MRTLWLDKKKLEPSRQPEVPTTPKIEDEALVAQFYAVYNFKTNTFKLCNNLRVSTSAMWMYSSYNSS